MVRCTRSLKRMTRKGDSIRLGDSFEVSKRLSIVDTIFLLL